MLVRLLYASRAVHPVTADVIESILGQCRIHNPPLGITGILCHGGDVFLQALEGGRDAVNATYTRIARDPRHRDVSLLHFEETGERRFAHWTMGQCNLAKVNPSMLLKFSERPVLDPFTTSARASMALLEELIAGAALVGRTG
jgi:hypothetical protein